MKRSMLLILVILSVASRTALARDPFPPEHYCSSQAGAATTVCKVLKEYRSGNLNQTFVISHRGYWGGVGTAETSLGAVQAAYDQGYTITEVDVILTKDKYLVLCHDQQTNRATSLPPTPPTAGPFAQGNDADNGSWWRSINFNTTTNNTVPQPGGGYYPQFTAAKDAYYRDRFGSITTRRINTLDQVLDYALGQQIIVSLDIKSTQKQEWLETLKRSIDEVQKRNMAYKIIFKPGSTAEVTVSDIRGYLTAEEWKTFSILSNVVLINIAQNDRPHAIDKPFIDEWIAVPSLIGIEHIYKYAGDELLRPLPAFGNISVIAYTKSKGVRTGAFQPIPADVRGNAGGRGNFWNPPNGPNIGDINNLTGNLEYLFSLSPSESSGTLVTDRPDPAITFLTLKGSYSAYSKRSGVPAN